MKKIIIVDDHLLVREGLKSLLESTGEYVVVAEFPDGTHLLEKGNIDGADLVLLDISMPGKSGLEIIYDIRRMQNSIPIIIVSMYTEKEFAVKAIQAGANGYISKNSLREEILNALETVLKGGIYLTGGGKEDLFHRLNDPAVDYGSDLLSQLSEREYDVLIHLCKGETIKEISYELDVSNKTVSTYKARIMEKMQLNSLTELIKFGIENGLV